MCAYRNNINWEKVFNVPFNLTFSAKFGLKQTSKKNFCFKYNVHTKERNTKQAIGAYQIQSVISV